MILAQQLFVAQDVDLQDQRIRDCYKNGYYCLSSYLAVLFDAVENLLGHQLFEMRYRRLRAAADEAPLQVLEVIADALQAHIDLLVEAVEVGLGVRLHHLLVVVLVVLRDVLGTRHVPALVEVPLPARFI